MTRLDQKPRINVPVLFGDPPIQMRRERWMPGSPPEVQNHPGIHHTACDGCRQPYYHCSKCWTAHLRPSHFSCHDGGDGASPLRCDSCGTFVESVYSAAEHPGWFPAEGEFRGRKVVACSAICFMDILLQSDELVIQQLTDRLRQIESE